MKRFIGVIMIGIVYLLLLVLVTSCSQYSCPTYSRAKPTEVTQSYNPVKPVTMKEYLNRY